MVEQVDKAKDVVRQGNIDSLMRSALVPADPAAITNAARALLAESAADPDGSISASIYETGRIVSLAPWLPGHERRLDYLIRQQHDGTWGGPGNYATVPTLSATEALLRTARRPDTASRLRAQADESARSGLRALTRLLAPGGPGFADMIAAELIVPYLIAELAVLQPSLSLTEPPAAQSSLLSRLRADPAAVSPKLAHTLEILGEQAGAVRMPDDDGNLGCSPAATAAWIGAQRTDSSRTRRAGAYLHDAIRAHDGPVPGVTPITVFERAWVVAALRTGGIAVSVPSAIVQSLRGALTVDGASVGPGLLCDADTTAATLTALYQLGDVPEPDALLRFDTGEHFCCWPGERNWSVSANAHVLEAFATYRALGGDGEYLWPRIERLTAWLRDTQRLDGSWQDKWHASAFYATAVCVRALARADAEETIAMARRWVMQTRRADGSWGRWSGTAEETAYAVQILMSGNHSRHEREAAERGADRLTELAARAHPPLWHDKDLYAPHRVIAAEVLAARHRTAIS